MNNLTRPEIKASQQWALKFTQGTLPILRLHKQNSWHSPSLLSEALGFGVWWINTLQEKEVSKELLSLTLPL